MPPCKSISVTLTNGGESFGCPSNGDELPNISLRLGICWFPFLEFERLSSPEMGLSSKGSLFGRSVGRPVMFPNPKLIFFADNTLPDLPRVFSGMCDLLKAKRSRRGGPEVDVSLYDGDFDFEDS